VTIFDESAGAGCVSLHATLPSSWPDFQQVILESSPVFAEANALVYQIEAGDVVKIANGCSGSSASTVLSCLRALLATNFAVSTKDLLPMIAAASGQTVHR